MAAWQEARALLKFRAVQLLAITLFLAGIGATALQAKYCVLDPDIWWHLRVGEWILHGQGFPHTAIFSRFAQTNSWAAYSWVFEIIVAQLYRWFSLAALPTFLFAAQIIIGTAILLSAIAITNSCWRGSMLTAASLAACFYTLSPRPVLFTVVFFVVELAIIFFRSVCASATNAP